MVLDNKTFEAVGSLLRVPTSTVQYNGCNGESVCFLVGEMDCFKNWLSGVAIWVNESFQIVKIERIRLIQSTGFRKNPVEQIKLPIFSTKPKADEMV